MAASLGAIFEKIHLNICLTLIDVNSDVKKRNFRPSSTILTTHNEVYVMTLMVNGGHFEQWPPYLPQG